MKTHKEEILLPIYYIYFLNSNLQNGFIELKYK